MILDYNDSEIQYTCMYTIKALLNSKYRHEAASAFSFINATTEDIEGGLKHPDSLVRESAAGHPNISNKQLWIALNDICWNVRLPAICRIASRTPKTIMDRYFDTCDYVFIGKKEDWESICLLYL